MAGAIQLDQPERDAVGEAFFIGGIMITIERISELLEYNPDIGVLTWKVNLSQAKRGDVAGYVNGAGYCCVRVIGKMYLSHRLAWLIYYGSWPSGVIDHIDHNKTNNAISNLRDVSVRTNNQNKIHPIHIKNRTSQFLGVSLNTRTGKFQAKIGLDGKQKHLGYFDNEVDAYNAYLRCKKIIHEGNTL